VTIVKLLFVINTSALKHVSHAYAKIVSTSKALLNIYAQNVKEKVRNKECYSEHCENICADRKTYT
jgi:hypothetical protein